MRAGASWRALIAQCVLGTFCHDKKYHLARSRAFLDWIKVERRESIHYIFLASGFALGAGAGAGDSFFVSTGFASVGLLAAGDAAGAGRLSFL